MNILHHKSWHVRTKSNMERVRRDEAKAAEEEKRRLERQIQAENERRINTLRARADDRMSTMFGVKGESSSKDVSISDSTGHVNLFQDLEREERKNLGTSNKEHEEEKAKEIREWESKMGIQVYFADNTNELDKKKEWYETIPLRRKIETKDKEVCKINEERRSKDEHNEKKKRKRDSSTDSSDSERGKKKRKHKKNKKKKKKKHRRDSSTERQLEEEYEKEKKLKLQRLREDRIRRERTEAARTYALLHPESVKKEEEKNQKKPKYNSQFNPHLSRN